MQRAGRAGRQSGGCEESETKFGVKAADYLPQRARCSTRLWRCSMAAWQVEGSTEDLLEAAVGNSLREFNGNHGFDGHGKRFG